MMSYGPFRCPDCSVWWAGTQHICDPVRVQQVSRPDPAFQGRWFRKINQQGGATLWHRATRAAGRSQRWSCRCHLWAIERGGAKLEWLDQEPTSNVCRKAVPALTEPWVDVP